MDSMKFEKIALPAILFSFVVLIALAGCAQVQAPQGPNDAANPDQGTGSTEYVIEYTSEGYVPNEVSIKKGDTVKWVNKSEVEMWPASAKHPTHEVYPGSGITKCGTSEEAGIFDACKGIPVDGSYSFTFNETGAWFFHDHLDSKKFGQVKVE